MRLSRLVSRLFVQGALAGGFPQCIRLSRIPDVTGSNFSNESIMNEATSRFVCGSNTTNRDGSIVEPYIPMFVVINISTGWYLDLGATNHVV